MLIRAIRVRDETGFSPRAGEFLFFRQFVPDVFEPVKRFEQGFVFLCEVKPYEDERFGALHQARLIFCQPIAARLVASWRVAW